MLGFKEVNILGNILDFTVGRGGDGKVGISNSLQGDVLTLKYSTIVHFASENSMYEQVRKLDEESIQVLSNTITNLKKQFKLEAGTSLKIEELSNKSDLELIQATSNSPRKIAYYRRFVDVRVDI